MTTHARAALPLTFALTLCLLALLGGCISAGSNTAVTASPNAAVFPTVTGVNLHGDEVTLPGQLVGNPSLVIVAFEREQQDIINPWLPHFDELETELPNFHYYELPVINERTASERMFINNGMRMGIPADAARARTITIYTDRERFIDAAGIPSMDTIYLFVLSQNGEILYRTTGAYDEDKFQALEGVIKGLSGSPNAR